MMFHPSDDGSALIREEGWPDDVLYTIVPTRPPLDLGDVRVELALQGESPAFEFGYGDQLGDPLLLVARDRDGAIVPIDVERRFSNDFEADPEYRRLLDYTDVAVDETFICVDDLIFVRSSGPWVHEGRCFECPPVANTRAVVEFALERLRFWRAGEAWDGVTRVRDALGTDALPDDLWARCRPLLQTELRMRAVVESLSVVPEAEQLAELARGYYAEHFAAANGV